MSWRFPFINVRSDRTCVVCSARSRGTCVVHHVARSKGVRPSLLQKITPAQVCRAAIPSIKQPDKKKRTSTIKQCEAARHTCQGWPEAGQAVMPFADSCVRPHGGSCVCAVTSFDPPTLTTLRYTRIVLLLEATHYAPFRSLRRHYVSNLTSTRRPCCARRAGRPGCGPSCFLYSPHQRRT